jgi:3,4-dihydroxy 2-butanone 4-phosphate synthase / GTP cyclohydrolase II
MHPIAEILDDLRAGRMIVLVDDEDRENEGDLVCAAEFVTPQAVNFMLREGRGMMCVALAAELCDRLQLEPQGRVNTTQRGTAYTVSVDADARFGITTGVSASDRATTIRVLADPQTRPADLARPGHMQPLRARPGGVLRRAGQTEGSVDLCRLAGLRPAAVIIEVMNEDGTMARRDDLHAFCDRHQLRMCSVADVISHRLQREKLIRRIDQSPFETEYGRFELIAYESDVDPMPHVALVLGDVGRLDATGQPEPISEPVLVRMHSHNLLGDVFGDTSQPSGRTLQAAMRMIQREGRGAIVYLRHAQMGAGLLRRLQTVRQDDAQAPYPDDAPVGRTHATPGMRPPVDKRDYGIGSQILRDLGLRKLRLITNHPFTPTALAGFGLSIEQFVPVASD